MMLRYTLPPLLFTLLLTAGPLSALAGDVQVPEWKLSLASGRGVIENPIKGKDDGETAFLPSFSYYGERFFISNLTVGYTLLEEKNFYVDLVAQPNEDGFYYHLDSSALAMSSLTNFLVNAGSNTLEDIERDISVVAGPSLTLVGKYADLSLASFHDISEVHYGSETHLSLDKQFQFLGGKFGYGIGAIKKDADLVGYYYHVTQAEAGGIARSYALQYPPDDVTDRYARVHFSYPLGNHIDFRMGAKYTDFDMDGRLPLLMKKSETLSWFAGFQYSIGNGQ
ncbi:MipA/OmpV family protein [Microbulbifer bruguierae]|uniref:MipA/OmpV family protein n=1 Tax=Microbulbifer bruguierae TaxID=3029061 RepID=A0ABY8NCS7_9GAMM|nr:MipA/OmpV family protein [Microbulbifer bruguierae]WGL15557.1 MipA/OmpV family protein [Microbulbifer bruguierae]